jgi:hypothetical protein
MSNAHHLIVIAGSNATKQSRAGRRERTEIASLRSP